MKRQERHHLKENEFAKFVARTGESFRQHGRSITGTGVLVVVALLMVAGFFLWRANRQEKASTMLAEALATLEAPVAPPAIGTPAIAGTFPNEQARLDAALPQLMAAAEAFPSTDAGIEARYQAAAVLAELGRHDEARQRYQEVIDRDGNGLYGQTSRIGLARAASMSNDHDRAIEILVAMSTDTRSTIPADAVLAQLARAYEQAGRADEAAATWKRIRDEFPQSVYIQEATRRTGA